MCILNVLTVLLRLFIASFIHHSTQNPAFPTLVHSFIHTDLMVNLWHRLKHSLNSESLSAWVVHRYRPVILGSVTDVVLIANLTYDKLIFIFILPSLF